MALILSSPCYSTFSPVIPGPPHWLPLCALHSLPRLLKRSLCCAAWRSERLLGAKVCSPLLDTDIPLPNPETASRTSKDPRFTRTFHDARCHLYSAHVLAPRRTTGVPDLPKSLFISRSPLAAR